MEKSAVFFDIDGTIIDGYSYVPQSTYTAIASLRKNGHLAFICSGRSLAFLQNPMITSIDFDGIVASCGAYVEVNNHIIFQHLIDPKTALWTVDTVREAGFRPILEGPNALYLDKSFGPGDPYGDRLRLDTSCNLLDLDEYYNNWTINKLSCATEVPSEIRNSCFQTLSTYYDFMIHNDFVVEMIPKNIDKGSGMKLVCDYLNIPIERTYAFGDSVNDIGMIRTAACGIVMGNGQDEAKKHADYITAPLKEDGILKALTHFGLI